MRQREFTVYRSHHGPIVRAADGKWVSVRLMEEPVKALIQSYTRTKAKNFAEFKEIMNLHTNSSNNTVFADSEGHIAYFHSNFIPKRDTKFDWTKPVDGSDPATEWQGVHSVDEAPNVFNPKSGWLYNTNNWPWSAAGPDSPKRKDYPTYVERNTENPRGVHAIRVLSKKKDFTPDTVIAAAFDSQLPELELLVPSLLKAYERMPASSPMKKKLAEQIDVLRKWDYRWAADSVATALAVMWGEELWQNVTAEALQAERFAVRIHGTASHATTARRGARDGVGQVGCRLRYVADPLGRHQPVPAPDPRHRASVRRCRTEHSGAVHLGPMGIACLVRGTVLQRFEEDLRNDRQQLSRDRGVWRQGQREGRGRGRPERRSEVTTFRRSGDALRERQPA